MEWSFENLFVEDGLFTESSNTHIIIPTIYPSIKKTLSDPKGDRTFRNLVSSYIDSHMTDLSTSGPVNIVPFTDADKDPYFNLFGINKAQLVKTITDSTKLINDKANWKLIRQNPIFCVFYGCIKYYTEIKDEKGTNIALAIYALAVYPSVFSMFFEFNAKPDVMQYTIDNLSAKYIFKHAGTVFKALTTSISNSYKFLKPYFADASDKELIRWVSRIRNDQKSLIKNIANEYYMNDKKGLRATTQNETYDDGQMIDNVNNTTVVEDVTKKVVNSMITNTIDTTRAFAAAKVSQCSRSDLLQFLSMIMVDKRMDEISKVVESILFVYLYDEHHERYEINERKFLSFSMELFRRTNSKDINVKNIKDFLNKWANDIGITERFHRESSQVNYKKGIFMYIILCIQNYSH